MQDLDFITIADIESATDCNDHWGSRRVLARALDLDWIVDMIGVAQDEHIRVGHLNEDLANLRKFVDAALFPKARETFSNFDEIYRAF